MNLTRTQITLLIALLLAGVTCATYLPVLGCGFVNYDDPGYVTANSIVAKGLGWESAAAAFKTVVAGYWQPVTILSHETDVSLYGMNPVGHHLSNLLLHVANVLLLFLWLAAATGAPWRSAAVAALFALHPVNVESVAWVAERKNLLSAFFFLLALASYTRHAARPSAARYLPVLGLFALSLMSKPMMVTLPFLLLLVDYWPLQRWAWDRPTMRRLALEKLPLLVLSAVFCWLTMKTQGGSGAVVEGTALAERFGRMAANFLRYLDKVVAPRDLAVLYPRIPYEALRPDVMTAVVLLALATAAVLFRASSFRFAVTGWFWFLGVLVPMAGFVGVGYHEIADRFAYVSAIGLFILAVWGLAGLTSARRAQLAASAAVLLLLGACAAGVRAQLRYWRDSRALFERAIAVTPGNFIMHDNLGVLLAKEGRQAEAIAHFEQALAINPADIPVRMNLGLACLELGRTDEALQVLEEGVALTPGLAQAHATFGMALARTGHRDRAVTELAEAVRLDPALDQARFALGMTLLEQGRVQEAADHLAEVARRNPGFGGARAALEKAQAALRSRP